MLDFWIFMVTLLPVPIASLLFGLVMIVPGLAVNVRRLHDQGRTWEWLLINFIPVVGSIWYFILMLMPSKPQKA